MDKYKIWNIMGYVDEAEKLRGRIYQGYVRIIERYGKNGELDTFKLCSDYDLRLDDRKIDKMKLAVNTIVIYYSEKHDYFTYFGCFGIEELAQFYDGLVEAIAKEEEYKALGW